MNVLGWSSGSICGCNKGKPPCEAAAEVLPEIEQKTTRAR